jgi:hypothetical protein
MQDKVELNFRIPYFVPILPSRCNDFTVETLVTFLTPTPLPTAWFQVVPIIQMTIIELNTPGTISTTATLSAAVFNSSTGTFEFTINSIDGLVTSEFAVHVTITYHQGPLV